MEIICHISFRDIRDRFLAGYSVSLKWVFSARPAAETVNLKTNDVNEKLIVCQQPAEKSPVQRGYVAEGPNQMISNVPLEPPAAPLIA